MSFDLTTITTWAQAGSPVVFLAAIIILWRHSVNMQSRYEAMLERCVSALVRVNDHLEKESHHED